MGARSATRSACLAMRRRKEPTFAEQLTGVSAGVTLIIAVGLWLLLGPGPSPLPRVGSARTAPRDHENGLSVRLGPGAPFRAVAADGLAPRSTREETSPSDVRHEGRAWNTDARTVREVVRCAHPGGGVPG